MPTLISGGRWLLSVSCAALCSGLLLSGPGSAATPARADPRSPVPLALTPSPAADGTYTPAPVPACTTVFPVGRVEELLTVPSSIPQLEAAFGRAAVIGGRPTRLRIETRGCTLLITPGDEGVQEAELVDYGALDWLLARYGDPAAVGVSQGNLVLPMTGYTVLLYPDAGVVAMFASEPEALASDMPVSSLFFYPPYTQKAQVRRLHLQLVEVDTTSWAGLPTQ